MTVRKGKPYIAPVLAAILVAGLFAHPTFAQSTEDRLEEAKRRLSQVEAEAQRATVAYEEAHETLILTRDEIDATRAAQDRARNRISGLQDQLDARAHQAYQLGIQSTWELLLEAEDFSEFSDRLVYLDRLAQGDADLATRVAVLAEELRRHQERLARLEEEQQVAFEKAQREFEIIQDRLAEAQAIRDKWQDQLEAKEGLALVNGTEGMLALGTLALHDARALLSAADLAAAMSIEGGLGTDRPFAEDVVALRPHPGPSIVAANLRALLGGSPIIASHRDSVHAVQDPYSMRCAPQVHGAARDAAAFASDVFDRERAAVVDNPVILPDGRVESTGNFHGEPLAYAMDLLAIALTGLASISERRTYWLLGPGRERDLPPFLSTNAGLESGYMLAQYTQAGLVSECRVLSQPAGVDSIPTSGTQEDHVSMGWLSGLKLRRLLEHVATVVAIEAVVAAQALDLRRRETAPGTAAAVRAIRARIPFLDHDRDLSVDIAAATELVREGTILVAAREAAGELA